VIEIRGAKSGEDVEYKISWLYSIFTNSEEKLEFYRKFGTTAIAVALPAIVGAKMCMEGEADRGVIAPECLGAVKFLKMMAELGAPVNFYEACSKKIFIS
jgi:saccharopine dehydrogenase-like NADP-dependent oxidoreductase